MSYFLEELSMSFNAVRDAAGFGLSESAWLLGFSCVVSFLENAGCYGLLEEVRGDSTGRFA